MSADAIKLGTVASRITGVLWVGRHAHALEPVGAAIKDLLHAGHRLDVVHDRRFAEQTFNGRKWRLDPRPGPFPLETFDQTGFFTADICRGAAMKNDVQVESLSLDILAKQPRRITLVDRLLKHPITAAVFISQIDVSAA